MLRTRAAAIDGARRVLAERGVRRTTMSEVAVRGGVAKATLYNHVRTKADLLALVVEDARERVVAAAGAALSRGDLAGALTAAAEQLAQDEVLVGLRRVEPTALLPLVAPGDGPEWQAVRVAVCGALERADRATDGAAVDLVLRWLLSFVLSSGTAADRSGGARRLALALPARPARTAFLTPGDPGR